MSATQEILNFTADDIDICRLDKYLSIKVAAISRTKIKCLIKNGNVNVNGNIVTDPGFIVRKEDKVTLTVIYTSSSVSDMDLSLNFPIVYEDEDLMVIDKPAGLLVHPGSGRKEQTTLVDYLRSYCGDKLSTIAGEARPGIVHRLDMETSGLMIVAKNDITHSLLANQLEQRMIKRIYKAITWGVIAPQFGRIETFLQKSISDKTKVVVSSQNGKLAITNYKVLSIFQQGAAALLEVRLETGRTHQIRVHLAYRKTPVIGDKVYGKSYNYIIKNNKDLQAELKAFPRHALHSAEIAFTHPYSKEELAFSSDLPSDMKSIVAKLSLEY